MANYNSSSQDRKVQTYLKPRTHMMFLADTQNKLASESSRASEIISSYFENLPKQHQEELLIEYKRLEALKLK